jgi:hypothetical protein
LQQLIHFALAAFAQQLVDLPLDLSLALERPGMVPRSACSWVAKLALRLCRAFVSHCRLASAGFFGASRTFREKPCNIKG